MMSGAETAAHYVGTTLLTIVILTQFARIWAYQMLCARLRDHHAVIADELRAHGIFRWLGWPKAFWFFYTGSWKVNRFIWSGSYRTLDDDRVNLYCRAWQYLCSALLISLLLLAALIIPSIKWH
jgi:hypothetical protein